MLLVGRSRDCFWGLLVFSELLLSVRLKVQGLPPPLLAVAVLFPARVLLLPAKVLLLPAKVLLLPAKVLLLPAKVLLLPATVLPPAKVLFEALRA